MIAFDTTAPAGRLTGAVARPAEDAREDVGLPVDHVRVGVATVRDQPDVLRHIGVRRTGPLAVDNLMVVPGIGDVCWAQAGPVLGDTALSPSVGGFSRRKRPDCSDTSTSGTRITRMGRIDSVEVQAPVLLESTVGRSVWTIR